VTPEGVYVTGLDWVRGTEEPLDTFSRPIETISWDEVALDDRAAFDKNLRVAGLSKESVSEALAVRDVGLAEMAEAIKRMEPYENIAFSNSPPGYIAAQNFYDAKRKSALQKLGDWWNQRVTTVEAVEPLLVRVPLFVLGAPSAPDCKAEWTNEIVSGFSSGWTLTLAGSGFASDAGSTYITSANFEASSGQTKLIFCDVALQLEHVAIHQPNKPPVRRWRIDLTKVGDGTVWPGLLLLDPDAVPPSGDFVRKFPLAGDPSGSLATYKEKYSRKTKQKVNVGLNVKGVELGLSATSDFGSDIEIKYSLKSGIDYELLYASDCDGYLFGATP
jgi:hypothetical protein